MPLTSSFQIGDNVVYMNNNAVVKRVETLSTGTKIYHIVYPVKNDKSKHTYARADQLTKAD